MLLSIAEVARLTGLKPIEIGRLIHARRLMVEKGADGKKGIDPSTLKGINGYNPPEPPPKPRSPPEEPTGPAYRKREPERDPEPSLWEPTHAEIAEIVRLDDRGRGEAISALIRKHPHLRAYFRDNPLPPVFRREKRADAPEPPPPEPEPFEWPDPPYEPPPYTPSRRPHPTPPPYPEPFMTPQPAGNTKAGQWRYVSWLLAGGLVLGGYMAVRAMHIGQTPIVTPFPTSRSIALQRPLFHLPRSLFHKQVPAAVRHAPPLYAPGPPIVPYTGGPPALRPPSGP